MTKTIKYIIGIVTVIIILLLVTPFFISLDSYKKIIALQVKEHSGRELKIDGPISLDILPVPQIKLAQLNLSSLPQAKTSNFLEAEMVSAKLALFPLLKGKIVISSLELKKPVINLEKLKNGKGTWEFQSAEVADRSASVSVTQTTSSQSKNSPAKLPFIINDISIQGGRLKYIDKDKNIYIEDMDLDINITDIYSSIHSASTILGSSQAAGSHWSHKRIDLSGLSSANATISLKAKKLTDGAFLFENITMKSELEDGVLKIRSLTGGLYGGKLEGSGSISAKTSQPMALKLTLKNAKVQNVVPEGRKIKVIGGIVDFACDIQSHGFSQFDYVKNMHGSINLSGKDGRVSGIDLHKLIHALDKPSDISAFTQGLEEAIGKGETAFTSLKSDVSIEIGVMNITKSELISNETSVVSEGKMNLSQFTLDVFATVNSGVKHLPPVIIHFYGPLDNPQHKLDVKAIWQHLVNHALTGVIDNLKQGKIKPKDLLKGIFNEKNEPSDKADTAHSNTEDNGESPQDGANKLLEKGIKGLFK